MATAIYQYGCLIIKNVVSTSVFSDLKVDYIKLYPDNCLRFQCLHHGMTDFNLQRYRAHTLSMVYNGKWQTYGFRQITDFVDYDDCSIELYLLKEAL